MILIFSLLKKSNKISKSLYQFKSNRMFISLLVCTAGSSKHRRLSYFLERFIVTLGWVPSTLPVEIAFGKKYSHQKCFTISFLKLK